MTFLYLTIAVIIGFIIGVNLTLRYISFKSAKSDLEIKSMHEKVYKSVLDKISTSTAKFVSRVNNSVQFNTNIPSDGDVSIIYFIDRKEVAIFREQTCLYTSSLVSSETLDGISVAVWNKYSNMINDTVSLLGNVYDKQSFVRLYGNLGGFEINLEALTDMSDTPNLNLDDILDKINKVGYDNLSDIEKEFLKNLK